MDSRRHRLFWWKEAALAAGFYAVYSWTRNQFGSALASRTRRPTRRSTTPRRSSRSSAGSGSSTRSRSRVVPALPAGHPVHEHLLRQRPLRRHARGVRAAVLEAPGRVPAVAQHARLHDRLAIFGFALFPLMPPRLLDARARAYGGACIASACARRRHVRLRRHPRRLRRAVVVRHARRWPRSPTSTPPCRACTSAGRRGAAIALWPLLDRGGCAPPCSRIRW